MKKTIVIAAVLALATPSLSVAHPGGLNKEGCHTNKKSGEYHCHQNGKTVVKPAPKKTTGAKTKATSSTTKKTTKSDSKTKSSASKGKSGSSSKSGKTSSKTKKKTGSSSKKN